MDALSFMQERRLNMAQQATIFARYLGKALLPQNTTSSIKVGEIINTDYKPRNWFVIPDKKGRGEILFQITPNTQGVKTAITALFCALSEEPMRTFLFGHQKKGNCLDMAMAYAMIEKVMKKDETAITVNLYERSTCGCIMWSLPIVSRSRCLGKTRYSYTGHKMGCGGYYSHRTFLIKRVDWLALARSAMEQKEKEQKEKEQKEKEQKR